MPCVSMPSAVIMPSGCSWLQEADPEGHGLWSVTTSRRLPEPSLRAVRGRGGPGGRQTRPQCGPPRSGQNGCTHVLGSFARRRGPDERTWVPPPRAQTRRHCRSSRAAGTRSLRAPAARPAAQPAALTTPLAGTARRTPGKPGRRWQWPSADRKAPSLAWRRPCCPASGRPAARARG